MHLVLNMFIFTRILVAHIHEDHLHATLLPQLSKYAHASRVYLLCV